MDKEVIRKMIAKAMHEYSGLEAKIGEYEKVKSTYTARTHDDDAALASRYDELERWYDTSSEKFTQDNPQLVTYLKGTEQRFEDYATDTGPKKYYRVALDDQDLIRISPLEG